MKADFVIANGFVVSYKKENHYHPSLHESLNDESVALHEGLTDETVESLQVVTMN